MNKQKRTLKFILARKYLLKLPEKSTGCRNKNLVIPLSNKIEVIALPFIKQNLETCFARAWKPMTLKKEINIPKKRYFQNVFTRPMLEQNSNR